MEGFRNFVWFMGQVEDNNDPQRMGRVRVRAFGFHSPDPSDIPTLDLPWATLISGTYDASMKPPQVGSWAFGFFADGEDAQHPMLLGTLASMPTNLPQGVVDQTAVDHCGNLFQPDLPRLARGEELGNTGLVDKELRAKETVKTADGKEWNRPASAYNASYPNNKVLETASGHVMEFDDTPNNERVNIHHASGTSMEMDSVGNIVIDAMGTSYTVIDRNGYVHVKGSHNVTVEGSLNVMVGNDLNLVVEGDMNHKVHGKYSLDIGDRMDVNIANTFKQKSAKAVWETNVDGMDFYGTGSIRMESAENISKKASNMFSETSGSMHQLTGGSLNIDTGGKIYMASGTASGAEGAETSGLAAPIEPKAPLSKNKLDKRPMRVTDVDEPFTEEA